MTDRQIYIDRDRSRLELRRSAIASDTLFLSAADGVAIASISIPTTDLLAMIDAADPDAMRAYLRKTAPEVIADVYRPAPAAAEHFDYLEPVKVTPERLDSIPEADSPEDIDEHPEPGLTVAPEILAAAELLGRYAAEIRAAFTRGLAR